RIIVVSVLAVRFLRPAPYHQFTYGSVAAVLKQSPGPKRCHTLNIGRGRSRLNADFLANKFRKPRQLRYPSGQHYSRTNKARRDFRRQFLQGKAYPLNYLFYDGPYGSPYLFSSNRNGRRQPGLQVSPSHFDGLVAVSRPGRPHLNLNRFSRKFPYFNAMAMAN